MTVVKYRKMTKKQLEEAFKKAQEELSDTRFDVRIGQEKDYDQIKWKKKEISRMHTVLQAHEYSSEAAAPSDKKKKDKKDNEEKKKQKEKKK